MTDTMKQKQIVHFNDFINQRIKRYQKLAGYLQRAVERNVIIYDSTARPDEISARLYELVIEHNKNIAYVFNNKDLELFFEIKDYLFRALDCCTVVSGKTQPILFINNEDEPILGFF